MRSQVRMAVLILGNFVFSVAIQVLASHPEGSSELHEHECPTLHRGPQHLEQIEVSRRARAMAATQSSGQSGGGTFSTLIPNRSVPGMKQKKYQVLQNQQQL